ncbi:MAG: PQQ-dependent sugar dehydrogenase [Erysipelothrix sp.]|nr:PQQ-dependent sugar dehydrogenase [Erysipelothrix sp.]
MIRVVTTNLESPWSIVFYADIPLVSLRDNQEIIEILEDGSQRLVGKVEQAVPRGEGGLLGLAVYDNFLYTYYTTARDNRVTRFVLSGTNGSLSISDEEVILEGLPNASNHNGGRIHFGPDGMLYVTTGDAANPQSSQDLSVLSGKILRLTPEGDVPDDNPIRGSLIYSFGHRNPQGITWDEEGVMYSSELGQNTWDELNVIEANNNYGWPLIEGIEETNEFVSPIQQWATSEASPSGLTYHDGKLFIANLRGNSLSVINLTDLTSSEIYFKGEYGRIRDVTIAPDGSLWILTNNTDGRGSPSSTDDQIIAINIDYFK